MKNSTYHIICGLINFCLALVVFLFFDWPLWAAILLVNVSVYLQTYAGHRFSLRASLEIEEIPARGYEKRLFELSREERRLNELGFFKFDEIYLRISPDTIIFVYKHCELPIFLCHYHFASFINFDLTTCFDKDFSLTTTDFKHSSIASLRPANKMLQAFQGFPVEMLFNRHFNSVRFLESRGFTTKDESVQNFRTEFMKHFRESANRSRSFLYPAKVFYLAYFGNKARFSKPIQEQYLANQLQLPSFPE